MKSRNGFRAPSNQAMQGEINRLLKLFNAGRADVLEPEAKSFVQKYPHHLFGHKALTASLTMQQKHMEALAALDIAIPRFPGDTELHCNRAAALITASRFEEALQSADEAIRLDPKNAGAYANKGLALKQLGYWRPALDAYQKAIEIDPSDHKSLNNSGIALLEMELREGAVQCFEAALAVRPDYAEARIHLAFAQEELKFFKNAKEELAKVVDADPNHDEARSKLFQVLKGDCEFEAAAGHASILIDRLRADRARGAISVFPLLSSEIFTLADQRRAAVAHAEAHLGHLMQRPPMVSTALGRPERDGALRIGYLSADFHHHATSMLLAGVLEAHDKNRVEVFAYSHGVHDGSPVRLRIEQACSVFRQIKPLSFTDAAQLIAEDRIDILVDLKGYTKENRLEICALRPAPVIVSWLGYPGTLGHPRLADYVIGDPIVTPPDHQPFYSETLALMPHCYQPNDNLKELGVRPSRQEAGLPDKGVVFCSFNQPYKITAPVFSQWCRILKNVPESVLWLMVDRPEVQLRLRQHVEQSGIDGARLVFTSQVHITKHLGRLQNADLALDTFPYGSHTTGSDALWAGVPLIAIKGNTFASRVSSSLLSNVGLPELITDSPETGADLAIALALDQSRLASVREKLEKLRNSTPLFDTKRFARDLETLYQRIWSQHVTGIREPIVLEPMPM